MSVTVDDTSVEAEVSVSLGLIVTKLVINAFKHAFPDQRTRTITIDFRTEGDDWTLSVIDDGIGMSTGPEALRAGLGSGIVRAITCNLWAEIQLSDAEPGTAVTITHRGALEELPSSQRRHRNKHLVRALPT